LWKSGELFEYWGHEASLIPTEHYPLFRWRMDEAIKWQAMRRLEEEQPGYLEAVHAQVRKRGPIQTRELDQQGERLGQTMWNWSDGKIALEALFLRGLVTTADRPNFVRMYDIPDRVIDRAFLEAPPVARSRAQSQLLVQAARAMGVASATDLGDYYRIKMPEARPLIHRLAETGELVEVEVEGWDKPGYLHPDAVLPREARGTALLSPFDNMIWFRDRVERLWDFHYRIEIYVPEPKRVFGYYVLPFLLDGDLVGRVDVKTDRKEAVLRVKGAFAESGVDRVAVGKALRDELEQVATWQGMSDLVVEPNGDLAPYL
ncbi:MAG: crosslink repair DNA glycosylase YcaQ family protein, partial [Acidimicrobiia bacterium]